jgi:hypothetical protein
VGVLVCHEGSFQWSLLSATASTLQLAGPVGSEGFPECRLGICAAWGYVPLGELYRGGPVFCRGFPVYSGSLYKKNVVSLAAAREDDIC